LYEIAIRYHGLVIRLNEVSINKYEVSIGLYGLTILYTELTMLFNEYIISLYECCQKGMSTKTKLTGQEKKIQELLDRKVSKSAIARILGVHRMTVTAFIKKK
jgi:hypothetical protein